MTKKDYIAIGKALCVWGRYETSNKGKSGRQPNPVLEVAEFIADVFEQDNPHFDRMRFFRYIETGNDRNR